jgi:hypothetical protein
VVEKLNEGLLSVPHEIKVNKPKINRIADVFFILNDYSLSVIFFYDRQTLKNIYMYMHDKSYSFTNIESLANFPEA